MILAILIAGCVFIAPLLGSAASAKNERTAAGGKQEYRVGDRLPQPNQKDASQSYKDTVWDALVPSDWDPMRIFKGIDLNKLNDADPRAMEALERLRKEWSNAPINASLNGARIRIPGFIVPLENQRNQITEFLLVPYFGACIHVPPPPANQIIHIFPVKPLKGLQTMDAVWVSGTLETTSSETGMGRAGYRMKGEIVVPYKESRRN